MTHTETLMTERRQLTVDIVSDVVCPWCIIGYRGLAAAAETLADRVEIVVRWHPFELAPATPPEGQLLTDYTRERYCATPEQSSQNRTRLVDTGKALGIDFRYAPDSRIYNSHKAHELLTWAGEQGKQTPLKLALFQAYFTDQANISEDAVLLEAVESVGLNRDEAQAILTDRRYVAAVDAEVAHWQDQNITGVPAYIVDGKYMIPGAQDAETFGQVLERVLEKTAGA
jgi:predicted DsbA family dithiol-disulfide isomerase